jgi:hypothetical protein
MHSWVVKNFLFLMAAVQILSQAESNSNFACNLVRCRRVGEVGQPKSGLLPKILSTTPRPQDPV